MHQFGSKVLPEKFLGYALYVGEGSGKETLWSQTLRNWSRWTQLNYTPEGSMQRKFEFPVADGTVKTAGGDQRLRTVRNEEKNKNFFSRKI